MQEFVVTSFGVTGLFGDTEIRINIKDNKFVIVGVNGLGKSTFLNLFYYFISQQWERLLDYEFSTLQVTINAHEFILNRDEIKTNPRRGDRFSVNPADLTTRVKIIINKALMDPKLAQRLRNARPISSSITKILASAGLESVTFSEYRIIRDFLDSDLPSEDIKSNASVIQRYLSENIKGKILYLPTYRRIEKDLDTVLPGFTEQLERYKDRVTRSTLTPASFLELVQFGMEDVEQRIASVLTERKEKAREELNNLAGSYLGDVIRGDGDQYDTGLLAHLTVQDVDDILDRVEERTLSSHDKDQLREVISTIREHGTLEETSSKYVAHFFVKLLHTRQTLKQQETPIADFVEVCNGYLVGKQMIYDDVAYAIRIMRNGQEINMSDLSSGEKQIVSLFSQVYLGNSNSYIVVIDEPELSLSVNWQKTLLPDIESSKHCTFMAAVTHSPFIFANDFSRYTVDLDEFVEIGANVVS